MTQYTEDYPEFSKDEYLNKFVYTQGEFEKLKKESDEIEARILILRIFLCIFSVSFLASVGITCFIAFKIFAGCQ